MKRGYFVQEEDADYGIAVVASSSREAKKIGFHAECMEDEEWINITVQWKKGIDVSNLKIGILEDYLLALKLGFYGYIDNEDCPTCKNKDVTVYYEEDKYYCSNCEDTSSSNKRY